MDLFSKRLKSKTARSIANLQICRACLATDVNMTFLHAALSDVFSYFSGLKKNQSDNLPPWLCMQCLSLLKKCTLFRNLCQSSTRILTDYLPNQIGTNLSHDHVKEYLRRIRQSVGLVQDLGFSTINMIEYCPPYINPTTINNVIDSTIAAPCTATIKMENDVDTPVLEDLFKSEVIVDESIIKQEILDVQFNDVDSDVPEVTEKAARKVDSGPHVCEFCKQRFSTRSHLMCHYKRHMMRYTCKICNRVLSSKQTISAHMSTAHDPSNKPIICCVCNKTCKNKFTYTKHMRVHTDTKEFKCYRCPKVFLWKDNLIRHLTLHKEQKTFVCDLCPKAFFLEDNLKSHRLTHVKVQDKKFHCVECKLSYASQTRLNQHLKRGARHMQPELLTFPCSMCDMRYFSNFQLTVHVNHVHLGKRPHACQLCDNSFVGRHALNVHVKTKHEGYRKPKLEIREVCGKAFAGKTLLKAHMRTHTGERPYMCKHCSATFTQWGALYTHIKLVHLKVKPGRKPTLATNHNGSLSGTNVIIKETF